jgi:excinuclease UvrABC nuclease subunit
MIPRKLVRLAPNSQGIYFLFNLLGNLVYIGKTKNIALRLAQHNYVWKSTQDFLCRIRNPIYDLRATKPFEYFDYIALNCSYRQLGMIERKLIDKYTPKFNDECCYELLTNSTWTDIVKGYYKK